MFYSSLADRIGSAGGVFYCRLSRQAVQPAGERRLADFTTPIEVLKQLKRVSRHCYLLESAVADARWGRYTFLGFDPRMEVTCRDGRMQVGDIALETDDPAGVLRGLLARYRSPRLPGLPTFTGGLVGYFAYEYFGYAEPSVRGRTENTEQFRDLDLMLFDKVIAFDHVAQVIHLIVNMRLCEGEAGYNKAALELDYLRRLLLGPRAAEPPGRLTGDFTPLRPRRLILSPGPGRPEDAGVTMEAARTLGPQIPTLGVCLGHQAICAAFGAAVIHAKRLMHGKQSQVTLAPGCPLFRGPPPVIPVARYHSLAADPGSLPDCLAVTARAEDGEVMAVQHRAYPICGVQFHPESILTPDGAAILQNFLREV